MAIFTWIPEYGAEAETKYKVNKASFGDGYEQRTDDGINSAPRIWNLTFMKKQAEINDIVNFLNQQKGRDSFTWTPPRGSSGKWVCDSHKLGIPSDAYDNLTATFREVFGE